MAVRSAYWATKCNKSFETIIYKYAPQRQGLDILLICTKHFLFCSAYFAITNFIRINNITSEQNLSSQSLLFRSTWFLAVNGEKETLWRDWKSNYSLKIGFNETIVWLFSMKSRNLYGRILNTCSWLQATRRSEFAQSRKSLLFVAAANFRIANTKLQIEKLGLLVCGTYVLE